MIKQEDLFNKLGLILNELNEQYQFLAQNPQKLNELELELFHANANFLADHVQIIKKINANQQPTLVLTPAAEVSEPENVSATGDDIQEVSQIEEITFANEPTEIPEVIEEKVVEQEPESMIHFEEIEEEVFKLDNEPSTFEFILNDHSEHEKFDFEEKSVDELFNRPLSEEEELILAQKRGLREEGPLTEETADDDEIGPEPFLVQKEEEFPIEKEDLELEIAPIENTVVNKTEPVEDPTYKPTLNDLLAKSNATNINSTTTTDIKDLKQAINLNDKLLYIKDLFNGYNLAYAEAIDLANKLPNFEAADNFFQKNYAAKNNWAEKQATVDKFYLLLNQRFK
ncbi:hypothetical protein FA048_17865 [Pedobacter polaris]|uniref:Uncharacterized protein n=1 Tax=Pedobacter polaris TaxID=2571273 RepID=A0A4V5P0N1_9SPHI|nr:hypothetical protein [Pedobacter polaris]TKC05587.1 hypothetical protein FA048_17865 [Pedobacter polaris]